MSIPPQLLPYATKLGFPESETLGKIFAILFKDPDSIAIAGVLPGTVKEISARSGIAEERVREVAKRLARRGIISRILHKEDAYRLFPAMIELRDATVITPDYPQELFDLWEILIRKEMPKIVPLLKSLDLPPMLRVIPIEETVESATQVLDVDSARKIIKGASLITAIPCPCRMQANRVGRAKDCPAPKDVNLCLQVNGFAEAVIDRGVGERLSTEEALRRLSLAEEAGLVHTARNNIKTDMFMCNCCSCCCTALFLHNQIGYRSSLAPSRFRARMDESLCTGCGACGERCPFQAIGMEEVASIDVEKCYGCGNCVLACPVQAIILEEARPPEFIRKT
jgi:ferredoxin/DNA-binding Lrp family transcriptional regulator